MEYTFISIFAGCGGSSLGYKDVGFKELLAIDFNKNAVETFKLNFKSPIWLRDIKEVKSKEILDFCKIKKGELDLLDGSPPCQGFSMSEKREINDNRNDLFKEFVRLTNELQPKVFVMENVSGMIKGKMKGRFIEIINILKELNYNVKCKLMNAKYYQVPQSRERLIFIGIREDLKIEPCYPKPNKKVITVKEALKNCPSSNNFYKNKNTKIYKLLCKCKQGKYLSEYNKKGNYFNYMRLHFNKVSPTITKGASKCIFHYKKNRFITIEEIKILQSFPKDFKLIGSLKEQCSVMGNSVPPKMMYYIAKNIKENILDKYYERN